MKWPDDMFTSRSFLLGRLRQLTGSIYRMPANPQFEIAVNSDLVVLPKQCAIFWAK